MNIDHKEAIFLFLRLIFELMMKQMRNIEKENILKKSKLIIKTNNKHISIFLDILVCCIEQCKFLFRQIIMKD
jgi:hypothetical protein